MPVKVDLMTYRELCCTGIDAYPSNRHFLIGFLIGGGGGRRKWQFSNTEFIIFINRIARFCFTWEDDFDFLWMNILMGGKY